MFLVVYGQQLVIHFREDFMQMIGLNCYCNPVFLGPATTSKGVKLYDQVFSLLNFFGGTKVTEPIPLEFDTSIIRIAAYR